VIDSSKVATLAAKNGMDDMNAMFEAAESPEQPTTTTTTTKSLLETTTLTKNKEKKAPKKPKTPKDQVRMSLPGSNDSAEEEDDDDNEEVTEAKKFVNKLRPFKGRQPFSPSEISHVSTAPPTPRTAATPSLPEEDDEEEPEYMTQEEEEVLPQAAEKAGDTPQVMESPEASFPVDNQDDDIDEEEGDDLGPPVLPENDDSSVDPLPEPQEEEEETLPTAEAVTDDKPLSDTESDGDNGADFNMVHSPETPKSVRDQRADKERAKLEKERSKKKKKKLKVGRKSKSTASDDTEEEEITPPRKASKKRKKRVAFSPKGIPIANRDYETVPLADLVEGSPEDENLRRSRRAKVKPLQFWRNEKLEFGAHEESGVLGEVMGDMPVVKHVVKALPTPYRKRKPPPTVAKRGRKNAKKGEAASPAPAERSEEPFDARKLKRKLKIMDGETAHIWDDGADDSADLSKYTWLLFLLCLASVTLSYVR
jgi:centromere protein C